MTPSLWRHWPPRRLRWPPRRWPDWSGRYYIALKFHLTVSEYLNGSGANSITALTSPGHLRRSWEVSRPLTDAEAAIPRVTEARDTTWDDREAVFFLSSTDRLNGAFNHSSRRRQRILRHPTAYWLDYRKASGSRTGYQPSQRVHQAMASECQQVWCHRQRPRVHARRARNGS